MPSHPTSAPRTTPDLAAYDLLAPQLSDGKDSAVMMAVFMEAARAAGVADRVISYHSSLGVLEWPSVVFDGIRYPGVSELAALQSAAFGVPNDRRREVTRTMPGPDGTRMPHSLLTEIAAYGRFPRMGSPYCRKSAKESVVSSAWTPIVSTLRRELVRPVRILKVVGLRSDEGPDRKKRSKGCPAICASAPIVWWSDADWAADWPDRALGIRLGPPADDAYPLGPCATTRSTAPSGTTYASRAGSPSKAAHGRFGSASVLAVVNSSSSPATTLLRPGDATRRHGQSLRLCSRRG